MASALYASVLFLISPGAAAWSFSIDVHSFGPLNSSLVHEGPPVHEQITIEAIESRIGGPAHPKLINNIKRGVQNADYVHQFQVEYHFDNATPSNEGFAKAFARIQADTDQALAFAQICDSSRCQLNPWFFEPPHDSFYDIARELREALLRATTSKECLMRAQTCIIYRGYAAQLRAFLAHQVVNKNPDPHLGQYAGEIQSILRMAKHVAGEGCNGPICGEVNRLHQQVRAYYGWQHLGHAFHTTQDFFAHSNYVELMAGKSGIPCLATMALCDDSPIKEADLQRLQLSDIPTPPNFEQFNETGLRTLLGHKYDSLQTGNVGWIDDPHCAGALAKQTNVNNAAPPYFHYCHWPTATTPGLNKDEPGGDAPSHANHSYARQAAKKMSAALWNYFLARLDWDARSREVKGAPAGVLIPTPIRPTAPPPTPVPPQVLIPTPIRPTTPPAAVPPGVLTPTPIRPTAPPAPAPPGVLIPTPIRPR
jgi:hypothetical protein